MTCKYLKVSAAVLIAALIFSFFAAAQTYDYGGKLTVHFGNVQIDSNILAELISEALELLGNTRESEDGTDVSVHEYWATQSAIEIFRTAIYSAQTSLQNAPDIIGVFAPGEYLTTTLRIEENVGFATMSVRVYIPDGLELTHIDVVGFEGMTVILPEVSPVSGSGYAIIAVFGSENFYTPAANLLTYTFKISDDANPGKTEPITFTFASAHGTSIPRTADGLPLSISLPGNNGSVGRVLIAREN
jgi:hypothetical protein